MNTGATRLIGRTASVAAIIAVVAIASGCGSPTGAGSFSSDAFPFEFDYPSSWTLSQSEPTDTAPGIVTVALREPFDQVQVASFKLKKPVPPGEQGNKAEVESIVRRVASESGGKTSDGEAVEFGGAKGYRYVVSHKSQSGVQLENRITLLFNGENLVQVSCQSADANRETVASGCDEIVKSLKLD